MLWLDLPWWFLWLQDVPQKKTRFISQKSGRYRPYSAPNNKVLVRVNKLGVLPLLRSKMGCIEFHGFILYWWILNIRSGIKVCEGKGKLTVLSSNQSSLKKKKGVLQGWNGLDLYFCSWPCVYLRWMSLKWKPQESKTCVTIKKCQLSGTLTVIGVKTSKSNFLTWSGILIPQFI